MKTYAGYRAFNGYIFTDNDARYYNAVDEKAEKDARFLDERHRAFMIIISQKDAAQ